MTTNDTRESGIGVGTTGRLDDQSSVTTSRVAREGVGDRPRHELTRRWLTATLALVLAAVLTALTAGPASAAVLRQSSRTYADCTMTAYLYTDSRGVFAGAAVPCSYWHPSVSVHTHLQVYDASYWNPIESNHWRNITIKQWGPYSGYGTSGQPTLWSNPGKGCGTWRAETQMSFTNSLPNAAQYVATASVTMCV